MVGVINGQAGRGNFHWPWFAQRITAFEMELIILDDVSDNLVIISARCIESFTIAAELQAQPRFVYAHAVYDSFTFHIDQLDRLVAFAVVGDGSIGSVWAYSDVQRQISQRDAVSHKSEMPAIGETDALIPGRLAETHVYDAETKQEVDALEIIHRRSTNVFWEPEDRSSGYNAELPLMEIIYWYGREKYATDQERVPC